MFQAEDGYDEYPAEINSIIEQAYRNKSPIAEWEEEDSGRYRVDFSTMTETKSGESAGVKVKRITPGKQTVAFVAVCHCLYVWDNAVRDVVLE